MKNSDIDPDNFTPSLNDGSHIFVFGSNLSGIHGKGGALEAAKDWGAKRGVGIGRTGQAYAIPTRRIFQRRDGKAQFVSLHLMEIQNAVAEFLGYAHNYPDLTFLVTKIGCGYAGFKEEKIKPLFKDAPANCILPKGWR